MDTITYIKCVWFKVQVTGGPVEEFARLIVSGACRGDAYVKLPSWYEVFLVYRAFAPDVLGWTFRLLFSTQGVRKTSFVGTGRPILETSPPRYLLTGPNATFAQGGPKKQE